MQFTVRERQIKLITSASSNHLIGDNSDYEAVFAFDNEWLGKTKTARFIMDGQYVDVVLTDNKCTIPVEILTKGYLSVGVYSSEMTTTSCEVYITPSVKDIGGNVADPTPDVYNQIIDAIDNIVIDEETVANAVDDYLDDHPITVTETDPTVPSYVKAISVSDIESWNNKSDFSGSYNDLTNKPTIPVVPTNISAFTNDAGYLTEHQSLSNYYTKSETYSKAEVDNLIPTVPTKTSDLINDAGYITSSALSSYSTTTEVQTMIDTAIGGAINGSY